MAIGNLSSFINGGKYEQRDSSVYEASIKQSRRFNGGVNNVQSNLTTLQNNVSTSFSNLDNNDLLKNGVIKGIQRGFHSYHYNNSSTYKIQISEIDPNKSFLFIVVSGYTGRYSWTLNSTNITINRNSTGEAEIAWEIVEFY